MIDLEGFGRARQFNLLQFSRPAPALRQWGFFLRKSSSGTTPRAPSPIVWVNNLKSAAGRGEHCLVALRPRQRRPTSVESWLTTAIA
jgi:hypothetical protein